MFLLHLTTLNYYVVCMISTRRLCTYTPSLSFQGSRRGIGRIFIHHDVECIVYLKGSCEGRIIGTFFRTTFCSDRSALEIGPLDRTEGFGATPTTSRRTAGASGAGPRCVWSVFGSTRIDAWSASSRAAGAARAAEAKHGGFDTVCSW